MSYRDIRQFDLNPPNDFLDLKNYGFFKIPKLENLHTFVIVSGYFGHFLKVM